MILLLFTGLYYINGLRNPLKQVSLMCLMNRMMRDSLYGEDVENNSSYLSFSMKRSASMSEILRPLADNPFQAYLSNAVQVADILEWILEQVGVAEVWQTSFSISEEFLRRLFFITKDKRFSRINLVLDHKATNKTLKLWAFITQVIERTYLADNHSKILLVKSERGDTISVITSQNLTRGNRHESAFISTEKAIFDRLHEQVNDLITNHSVPLHDLFRERIAAD